MSPTLQGDKQENNGFHDAITGLKLARDSFEPVKNVQGLLDWLSIRLQWLTKAALLNCALLQQGAERAISGAFCLLRATQALWGSISGELISSELSRVPASATQSSGKRPEGAHHLCPTSFKPSTCAAQWVREGSEAYACPCPRAQVLASLPCTRYIFVQIVFLSAHVTCAACCRVP
jgi:hypothetical protein